ncbi:zinc-dependent peptidase [bacterium]|nr:zinc-dependent peptidase [bacterium]
MSFQIVIGISILLIPLVFYGIKFRRYARRQKIMAAPFPESWRAIISKNMELYNHLPQDLKEQLERQTMVFVAEKEFRGFNGVVVTEEMRVTVAVQASLLEIGRRPHFFPKLHTVELYPGAYRAESVSFENGVETKEQSVRLGESWNNGRLVLAWDHVRQGIYNYRDGHSLVLHELAHQLDQEDGIADGAPLLENGGYARFAMVFSEEFRVHQRQSKKRRKTVMDSYGATNPAEFFAVATETFFEKGKSLKKKHPELYDELKKVYNLDPAEWF